MEDKETKDSIDEVNKNTVIHLNQLNLQGYGYDFM